MKKGKLFNRDLSWLSFNERVLLEAQDTSVPLYERIKFLAIYSSNLDEFFRVRVALLKRLAELEKTKLDYEIKVSSPVDLLVNILAIVNKQQNSFGSILRTTLLPELKHNDIILYYAQKYKKEHLEAVEELFYSEILSFIQPVIVSKGGKKPVFLKNRRLYVVSDLEKGKKNYLGIVNIPSKKIARFQKLPPLDGVHYYTFIDDIIKQFSHIIFAGFNVLSHANIKMNRDAELFLDDEYSDDTADKIRNSLNNREIGSPSRFLYEPTLSNSSLEVLKKKLDLHDDDCISGGTYHNMDDLFTLPNPLGNKLENIPLPPLPNYSFNKSSSIFDAIDKGDILLSFPYQKYDYILRFFNEAAINPSVKSITVTLYRVAKESHVTNALISAARNGKKVAVLVEAKARFDEENNLKWANKMQDAGVKVKYSRLAIKVHSKVALITCKSADKVTKKYAFLGTGNLNEKTADIYTDYALLTADPNLTNELDEALKFTFGNKTKIDPKHLLVSQVNLPEQFSKLLEAETEAALSGKKGRIILKLNNLQDKKMINKLYKAADAGVIIDLIIRGICCLVPQKNINLKRIVDRFLEHSRVYVFHNHGDEKIFLGSADWMERNLYRRIEVVFPIYDQKIKKLIKHNIELQLADNTKAVQINERLENIRLNKGDKPRRAQYDYYNYLKDM